MSAKKAASAQTAAVAAATSTPDNHISVAAENEIPKVTTRLIFPGPVVLGTITSTSVASGTVSYRRLYATAGGDTTTDSTTGSAVIPILR